jgi:hypothetical protein
MIMELNELDTMLRRADQLDRPVPVETLIEKSMHNGQQRARNRRLTVVGALAGSLAAVGIIAGLAFGPGPSVSMSPAADPKPSEIAPTQEPDKTGSLPTAVDLKKIIKAELPEGKITRKFDTEGLWGAGMALELGDKDGYGLAAVGIDRVSWTADQPTCTPSSMTTCEERATAGGVVWIGRDQEKSGDGTRYSLVRPNGTRVWFLQRNELNGQVERQDLPLSDAEAIELITATDWYELADQLPAHAPWTR